MSSLKRIENPEPVGRRSDQYLWFMRDDSDVILCSHPADVQVELDWLR